MREIVFLNHTFDLHFLEKLQNSISMATGMAIMTVDSCGIPVTSGSGFCEFCKCVRNDDISGFYCQKCNATGKMEGVISKKPLIYRCHYSIVDIVIPIIVDGNYLGAVIAGQVKTQKKECPEFPEQILCIKDAELQKTKEKFKEYYEQIPIYTNEQLELVANMLYSFCYQFIDELLLNDKITDHEKEYSLENEKSTLPQVSNQIIAQAIEYIYSAKNQAVPLTKVAEYCHVSAPYFSLLFKRETGETYSIFVSKMKIEWAKEILQSTDLTIMEISDRLGFSEPGYFIKKFKKYTNETPMNYRINYKNEKNGRPYLIVPA